MAGKRKHLTLTLDKKHEILKRLEKGEKLLHLATEYNVGRATIHDIKKKKDQIETFFKNNDSKLGTRKTLKTGEFPQVEEALYAWFLQERNRHTPISGELLMEKAKVFYSKIMNKDDFRASVGWLDKFKKRFGIRILSLTGERLSCDVEAVEPFVQKFKTIVEEMALGPDQIYNADESGLFWRLLPKKSFVHREEVSAPGRKLAKDRITFMPCANASGTHKLQLLVIGKSKQPRAFKNVNLPVLYKNQTKGWMTKALFTEWFHSDFVPSVTKFLKKQNLPTKALLLLDNCPGHPDEESLKSEDGQICVLYLPPNVTPLLQPMDQNVIQTVKTSYKKSLLYNILSKEGSVVQALKDTNLKDVVFYLASAWEKLSAKTIVCSWGNLWPSLNLLQAYKNKKQDKPDDDLNNLREIIAEQLVDDPGAITVADVNDWLVGEADELQTAMTDDEIVEDVLDSSDEDSAEGGTSTAQLPAVTVSGDKAVAAFATAISWAEENGASTSDLLVLKRLQENALKFSLSSKKQKPITSFLVHK